MNIARLMDKANEVSFWNKPPLGGAVCIRYNIKDPYNGTCSIEIHYYWAWCLTAPPKGALFHNSHAHYVRYMNINGERSEHMKQATVKWCNLFTVVIINNNTSIVTFQSLYYWFVLVPWQCGNWRTQWACFFNKPPLGGAVCVPQGRQWRTMWIPLPHNIIAVSML